MSKPSLAIRLALACVLAWVTASIARGPSTNPGLSGGHYHAHEHTHDGSTHSHAHSHAAPRDNSTKETEPAMFGGCAIDNDDHHCGSEHRAVPGAPVCLGLSRGRYGDVTSMAPVMPPVPIALLPGWPADWRPPPRAGPPPHLVSLRTCILLT